MNKPSGVLVDHNILVLTQGIEYTLDKTPFYLGGLKCNTPREKVNYKYSDNPKKEFNRYLARTLGKLAWKNKINLYSSIELLFESFSGNYPALTTFKFPELEEVEPPVDRSYTQSISFGGSFTKSDIGDKKQFKQFVDLILKK